MGHGRSGAGFSTSAVGNSTAFGFSITITCSFGVLQALVGSPTVVEILMFGVAAAAVVGAIEGIVTRGFRDRPGTVPSEVMLMGTAQNFVSVAAGVGTAAGIGSVIEGGVAWPAGAAAATLAYLLAEATETLVAMLVQERRGDPDAAKEGE